MDLVIRIDDYKKNLKAVKKLYPGCKDPEELLHRLTMEQIASQQAESLERLVTAAKYQMIDNEKQRKLEDGSTIGSLEGAVNQIWINVDLLRQELRDK